RTFCYRAETEQPRLPRGALRVEVESGSPESEFSRFVCGEGGASRRAPAKTLLAAAETGLKDTRRGAAVSSENRKNCEGSTSRCEHCRARSAADWAQGAFTVVAENERNR
ncbi:hypothetical protein CB1_001437029, partial [Camelus ferus]